MFQFISASAGVHLLSGGSAGRENDRARFSVCRLASLAQGFTTQGTTAIASFANHAMAFAGIANY
jgi:hypothetical protein